MSDYKNENDENLRKSRNVFVSILTEGGPTLSPSTSSAANAAQAFNTRVQDKRITLENLDRARPIPPPGSVAAQKIQKREKRLIRKSKRRTTPSANALRTIEIEGKFNQSDKPLSRRQRKRVGLDEVDENITYESLLQVHHLWLGYIQRLLGLVDQNDQINQNIIQTSSNSSNALINPANQSAIQSTIVKADFTGAPIRVIRSKNPSLVGIQGIVAKEGESTFQLISQPKSIESEDKRRKSVNKVKIIPKQGCVFIVQITIPGQQNTKIDPFTPDIGKIEITLYGNQLCNTLPTRATKKFKARKTIELDS
jgi:RNase P/RNase MRP subunit p29